MCVCRKRYMHAHKPNPIENKPRKHSNPKNQAEQTEQVEQNIKNQNKPNQ